MAMTLHCCLLWDQLLGTRRWPSCSGMGTISCPWQCWERPTASTPVLQSLACVHPNCIHIPRHPRIEFHSCNRASSEAQGEQ